jgi:hypothetical protein
MFAREPRLEAGPKFGEDYVDIVAWGAGIVHAFHLINGFCPKADRTSLMCVGISTKSRRPDLLGPAA